MFIFKYLCSGDFYCTTIEVLLLQTPFGNSSRMQVQGIAVEDAI